MDEIRTFEIYKILLLKSELVIEKKKYDMFDYIKGLYEVEHQTVQINKSRIEINELKKNYLKIFL
jgi:hypothetical protein